MDLIPELIVLSPFYSPFLLLETSIFRLTLFCSVKLCESLRLLLAMENCFTIKTGFYLLLCGCRILYAIVTQDPNPEATKSIPDL